MKSASESLLQLPSLTIKTVKTKQKKTAQFKIKVKIIHRQEGS